MNAGKTLLLCEDDPVQLQVLAAAFLRIGYHTVIGRSPTEAARVAKAQRIDVALADVQLENGSAFDLLRELRRTGSEFPVLLTSAYVTPALQERARASGAVQLIEKTGAVPELVAKVDAAVRECFRGKKAGRILLVDDHGPSRAVEAAILEGATFEVFQAESSQQALDTLKLASVRPDLVVLDLTVPGLTGAELVRQIRTIDGSIGIVVLAGRASQEEIVGAYAAGAASMVRKPFSEDRFLQVVRSQVAITRATRATAARTQGETSSWSRRLLRSGRQLLKHRVLFPAALSAAMIAMCVLALEAFTASADRTGGSKGDTFESRIIEEMRRFNVGYQKELRWNGIEH
jgi:DNA-binding response OmpR family regulator